MTRRIPGVRPGRSRDALTLLRTLNVDRAHVVGHSYGPVIALELASAEPSVVHSLALLEPPVTAEPLEGAEAFEPLMTMYASGDVCQFAGAYDVTAIKWPGRIPCPGLLPYMMANMSDFSVNLVDYDF